MPTFLIADDSDGKRIMLEAAVLNARPDITMLRAKDTDEAKDVIAREHIDFAFIDYQMPRENGPAVIRDLREKQPSVRVALVTASDREDFHENARAAGAEAVIVTSVDTENLERTLQDLLSSWFSAS